MRFPKRRKSLQDILWEKEDYYYFDTIVSWLKINPLLGHIDAFSLLDNFYFDGVALNKVPFQGEQMGRRTWTV